MWIPKKRNTAIECYVEAKFHAYLAKHPYEHKFSEYIDILDAMFEEEKFWWKGYTIKDIMYACNGVGVVIGEGGIKAPKCPEDVEQAYKEAINKWAKYSE